MKIKQVKPRIKCSRGVDVGARIQAVYEAAGMGPRMQRKGITGVGGPNSDISRSQSNLVKRSRHAVRNHPYAARAKEVYVSSIVGNGLTAKWPNKEMQALWDQWILHCSADDRGSMLELQMLAAGAQFESGEVVARRRPRLASDGLAVPLQIQLMEGDHLDIGYNVMREHNPISQGIQFNSIGDRSHYHLWKYHPEEVSVTGGFNQRVGVPANDVIHLYRRLRPGQLRGVPELTPILVRLYEIDEMQDATLVKQKVAQLFAWIVRKKSSDTGVQETNSITDQIELGETIETEDGEQLTKITAGGVHYLEDDEEIDFSSPDGVGANYSTWLKTELRACAVGAGITYEQLTGDLEGVNYSSIRAGLVEFRRRIEQLQFALFVHRFMRPIAEWFADTVVMLGVVSLTGYWKAPWAHLPSFGSPKWDWVDPLKDVMADLLEVRGGFNTLKNKMAERNLPFDETIQQLVMEQMLENLVLDTNPSKVTKAGQFQDVPEHLMTG